MGIISNEMRSQGKESSSATASPKSTKIARGILTAEATSADSPS